MPDSRNWFDTIPSSRRRHLPESERSGLLIRQHGRELVNFASNDYLGLSTHAEVCEAAIGSIGKHGLGSGASRLVSGDDPALHAIEQALAAWKGYEACLVAGSGMLANLGLLQTLANRHTHCFQDRLNHASLVDGGRLSGAHIHRYAHLDLVQLQLSLQRHSAERRIIVSDGVFSMDGDCADVRGLLRLADQHDTLLIIDDAHGIGTVGDGRGLTAAAGIQGDARLIEVGTFGKAFGGYGAFILGADPLIEGLRQRLRTAIYSTALPAAIPAAMLTSLQLIQRGELLLRLKENIAYFRQLAGSLPLLESTTPIQPLLLGSDEHALQAAQALQKAGYFVPAIRPPTVPEGTARLRITLSAGHSRAHIEGLVAALQEIT